MKFIHKQKNNNKSNIQSKECQIVDFYHPTSSIEKKTTNVIDSLFGKICR
jgi:hypothetical protein